ncbi:MAG: tRNA (adenosine(37)-N6)-threonylcarbamoyltransferase complex transferase subunit TsaD [Desulfotalea sp.]|nr:MAG: tRNA (adenosine(37)-N6)-threonylcarbamoyltransferase complex transferase subunit TsaD [Desulfotalea sp.]
MLILGIETSCDDTSAAVLRKDIVLSNVLSSQDDIHSKYGGVVPELASRQHLQAINPIVESALQQAGVQLSDIDLIAATQGPGLIGSLLVGFSYSKALSHVSKIPFVGVDHMAGHILSIHLNENKPQFPYIALIASGGTSSIYLAKSFTEFSCLGRTRDDAAGEAFDKVAKLLGLPYPGGPHVSKIATEGNPAQIKFPRAWLEADSLDFSFSGLKTAVLNFVNTCKAQNKPVNIPDICASFEAAVVEVLVTKTIKAAKLHNISTITIGGGVSANTSLRTQLKQCCLDKGIDFFCPQITFCTDNAAMIALAGYHEYRKNGGTGLEQDVYSRSHLG